MRVGSLGFLITRSKNRTSEITELESRRLRPHAKILGHLMLVCLHLMIQQLLTVVGQLDVGA
jgi:hypothetical protein